MRQTSATVMARTLSQGLAQESQAEYAAAGTVSGVFIPTGGAIVQKIYGQEYAGEFEFYTKKRNAALIAGNRLQIGSKNYEIGAVRDYVKAKTVLLTEVVGEDGA